MPSGVIASLIAVVALMFAEGLGRLYPARKTWWRLRRLHGRRAVRAMRERFEALADRRLFRILALTLLAFAMGWIASASLLDKRWHEVVLDVLPSAFVGLALLRVPAILRSMATRMRTYEREVGEDPDKELPGLEDGEGPTALAL
jgi:hypothetical protein